MSLGEPVRPIIEALDRYHDPIEDCVATVLGVHAYADTIWLQVHVSGAIDADVLVQLPTSATPADARAALRHTMRQRRPRPPIVRGGHDRSNPRSVVH